MTSSKLYPVAFIVALCWVCASVLTFAHTQWAGRIAANERFARERAVVDAFGLLERGMTREKIEDVYKRSVTVKTEKEMTVYEGRRSGKLIGYAVDVAGRGHEGPIRGILAVGPLRQRVLALRIYDQKETAGLGGRIESPKWLKQFVRKRTRGGIVVSATASGPNVVQAISGASKTSLTVNGMVNKAIAELLSGGKRLKELDLGLTADAVTRATPGYPKSQPRPPHLRPEIQRAPFIVPVGAANIARGRPVTSGMEDEPIIGELEQITDGVKKSGQFDYVELDAGPQWVQIDLGAAHSIYAVVIWHYYKNPVVYNDVIAQIADDAAFTQNVRTLFNNDHDNSSGLGAGKDTAYFSRWWGEIVDARGTEIEGERARFVRVHTNGGSAGEDTRLVEIAVYGQAVKPKKEAEK